LALVLENRVAQGRIATAQWYGSAHSSVPASSERWTAWRRARASSGWSVCAARATKVRPARPGHPIRALVVANQQQLSLAGAHDRPYPYQAMATHWTDQPETVRTCRLV
jgi:hypothetical protein